MPDDNSPNLDLIQLVQRARLAHDADALPSQVSAAYWIEAKYAAAMPTARAGHWLIRTDLSRVDADWAQVKAATEAGKLGYKSKVAAAAQGTHDQRVIHVLTVDADDSADVHRVGDALRALGFKEISYITAS